MNTANAQGIVRAANKPAAAPAVTKLLTSGDQVEIHTRLDQLNSTVSVTLKIKDGFHINANPASLDYLIPTRIAFASVEPTSVDYPQGVEFKPSFSKSALDVYEGNTTIIANFKAGALANKRELAATIIAQACNDTVCLPPSSMQVSVGQ
jgi:hypothetical protein